MRLKINFECVAGGRSRRRTPRPGGSSAGSHWFFVRSSHCHPFVRSDLTRLCQFQPRQPQEVVGGRHKVTARLRAFEAAVAAAPQAANDLDPADDFLNPFAKALADRVTLLASLPDASSHR